MQINTVKSSHVHFTLLKNDLPSFQLQRVDVNHYDTSQIYLKPTP